LGGENLGEMMGDLHDMMISGGFVWYGFNSMAEMKNK
jgi:hypothetical protein